jgi:hypothetical protein
MARVGVGSAIEGGAYAALLQKPIDAPIIAVVPVKPLRVQ